MIKIILVPALLSLALISCNSGRENNELLNRAPYKKLTDSISQDPKNASLFYRRGSLLYSNQLPDMAEEDLRKAWELDPREEYAISVSMVLRQESPDEAISFLEKALQKIPNSLFIQIQLAQGYKLKGNLNKSLQFCNQVISSYPNNIDAYLLKAEILTSQGHTREALTTMEQAYLRAPGDVELVHSLAFEYAEAKNPKALALSDSLIAADTEKSHAEPFYFKGVYYSNTGNYTEAIKQFDQAITTNHNFINAYINKGIIYYDQKKYREAIEIFSLAARVFPDEPGPYYWLGKTQEAYGMKEEARLNYQRACGLDKSFKLACEALKRI